MKLNALLIAGILLAGAALPGMAQRTRRQGGTWQGSRGNSGTWSRQAQTQPGQRSVSTTAMDSQGRQASRQRSVQRTGQDSGTFSSSSTGPRGRTSSTAGTVTRTEPGRFETSASTSTRRGTTVDTQATTTRTETGRITEGAYSTSEGKSGTFSKEVERGPGYQEVHGAVTNQSGKTATRDTLRTRQGNTVTGSTTVTGPNGGSRTGGGQASVNRP